MGFPKGVEVYDLPTGAVYLRLPYYADPTKTTDWLERERVAMAAQGGDFDREILMKEDVYGGEPVFKNYDDEIATCKGMFTSHRIPLIPGSFYFGCLDCGQTLSPAAVLLQMTPVPFQIHAIQEVVSFGGESMETFAPRMMDIFMNRMPGNWNDIRYFGDQTMNTRSGTNGRSARQMFTKITGEKIRPVSNIWERRRSAVEWMLGRWIDETTPGFYIDCRGCPVLRKALQGGYQYRTAAGGETQGPGQAIMTPRKDHYSHISDALQYGAVTIRKLIEGNARD